MYRHVSKKYINDYEDDDDKDEKDEKDEKDKKDEKKKEEKYEEKYINKFIKLENKYIFSDKELELEKVKYLEYYNNELETIKDEIINAEIVLNELNDNLNYLTNENQDDSNVYDPYTDEVVLSRDAINLVKQDIGFAKAKIENIKLKTPDEKELHKLSREFIIDERMKKFINKFIIEYTPLGNVLMVYNHNNGSFDYYSDVLIPYRYLEVVARKYVITFDCRPVYINMTEELQNMNETSNEESKPTNEESKLTNEETKTTNEEPVIPNEEVKPPPPKVKIFAKFKTYNKEAGTGHVSIAPPPKNSIPQNRITSKTNEQSIPCKVKEKSNKYSYKGKFANFSFIQKINRKQIDKKYATTYAEYKKRI